MEDYRKKLAITLAETGALFFGRDLILKDGRPTPYFVNMGMFRTGRLSMEIGSYFAGMMVDRDIVGKTDIVLGPSYKGSAIALATAIALYVNHGYDCRFEYDRKEAKTHGEGSSSASIFVNRTLFDGCRIFVVDDVATSMGTKYELLERIQAEADSKKIAVKIVGIGIAVDREQTTAVYDGANNVVLDRKGENAIKKFMDDTNIPVHSVAGITEIIEYLYKEKVPFLINGQRVIMEDSIKHQFDEYLKVYGHA